MTTTTVKSLTLRVMKMKKIRQIRDTILSLINCSPDMSQEDICTFSANIVKNVYRNVAKENDNGVERVSKLTGKYQTLSLTH